MLFKVNNKYIVDAKSHDEAIRVIKMLDAIETYSIRWIDTYAKSKGNKRDVYEHTVEIKADNVKEALQKLARQVEPNGISTENCLVMRVSSSHAVYQFTGRLYDLLRNTKGELEGWVKGQKKKYSIEWFDEEALSKGYKRDVYKHTVEFEAENIKEALEMLAKQLRRDGFPIKNCTVMSVLSPRWRHTYVAPLDKLLSKPAEHFPDSVKDADPDTDVDLDFLIKDEIEAIDGYRKMIAKTSNPQLLSVLSHILDEETEHVEELRAAQAGVYEVEDD